MWQRSALTSAALLVSVGVVAATNSSAAAPAHDAATDTITCNTVLAGTAKVTPPLRLGGSSESLTVAIKGSISSCMVTDASNDPVSIDISGQVKGTSSSVRLLISLDDRRSLQDCASTPGLKVFPIAIGQVRLS